MLTDAKAAHTRTVESAEARSCSLPYGGGAVVRR
jgi:hypothetical protein